MSVLTNDNNCYICGSPYTEVHHCIHGKGRRAVADRLGLTVPLCRKCHEEVHRNRELDLELIKLAQEYYEQFIGTREDFRKDFGKSWM